MRSVCLFSRTMPTCVSAMCRRCIVRQPVTSQAGAWEQEQAEPAAALPQALLSVVDRQEPYEFRELVGLQMPSQGHRGVLRAADGDA